jgi:hypothetical protein
MDQAVAFLSAGLAALVTFSVPLGLLGSVIEHVGVVFGFPRVAAFGDKVEKFFFDLPGLLKGRK